MLEPSDFEAIEALIRRIIKEENAILLKRLSDQNRQREHRERCHNPVTVSPGKMSQSVTTPREEKPLKDSPTSLPLFPSHTLPITPSSPTSSNTHRHYARVPQDFEEVKTFVLEKLKLTEEDALVLWEHWVGNGFKNNGQPMNSWKHTASKWERCGFLFPSKQKKPQINQNNGYQQKR